MDNAVMHAVSSKMAFAGPNDLLFRRYPGRFPVSENAGFIGDGGTIIPDGTGRIRKGKKLPK